MLKDLIAELSSCRTYGDTNIEIKGITFDSREVKQGFMFVAINGTLTDGHKYIKGAEQSGASAILCEKLPEVISDNVCYVLVENTHKALPLVAKAYYENPSSKLKLIGVTGTNGKTSTATLLYELFTSLGYKCGLVSTISYVICGKKNTSTHTTPDILTLNRMFVEMIEMGCDYCFMEVSSHAIDQHRTDGLQFDIVLFTNITHDHLDYHKTFENYIATKKSLFDNLPKTATAIVNSDDRNGLVMVQNCKAKKLTFSLRGVSDFRCKIIEEHLDGMLLDIDKSEIWLRFIGRFNAYNLLGVYAIARELGVEKTELLTQMSYLTPVAGRFDTLKINNEGIAVVDYAHTPDALENVLQTISEIRRPDQKVYTVVGCGGDRDKTKRPIMAGIAAKYSDLTFITSDNPRTENPEDIIADMLKGLENTPSHKYMKITSRHDAIKMAVIMASQNPKSILLVAGKGHETYQDVNGVKSHFDDKEEILKNL